MSDLTEFLLARLAEDEAVAQRMIDYRPSGYGLAVPEGDYDPLRVLAEVEAKRRIVRERNDEGDLQIVLQHLAAVYSDHPDYDEEWKP